MGNARSVCTLQELLSSCDVVTLHVPETPLTKNLIQAAQLRWMKKGSFLINTSRGSVLSISDVRQALQRKILRGAAIDVFPQEPSGRKAPFVSELQKMKQVILTPHIAGSTEEAQQDIAHCVSSAIIKYLLFGISEGVVNFPVLNPPEWDRSGQYQRLVNIHHNVPGVLADINGLVSKLKVNIVNQQLATNHHIGYLVMDVEKKHKEGLHQAIAALDTSIRTYLL